MTEEEQARETDKKIAASHVAQGTAIDKKIAATKHDVDVRLLTIFLLVIFIGTVFLTALTLQNRAAHRSDVRFERAIVANCQLINAANEKFNGVLDQLSRNAQNSTAITAEQKQQAIQAYASLHLPISVCPG